jgi:hypothetical protein
MVDFTQVPTHFGFWMCAPKRISSSMGYALFKNFSFGTWKNISQGCVCKTLDTSSKYIVISRSLLEIYHAFFYHIERKKNQKNVNSYYY